MKQTTNYQLSQWEAEDQVLRTDFNTDNAKIDGALGTLAAAAATIPKIAVGSYTGDGASSRTINVGFTPKAVLLFNMGGATFTESYGGGVYGGLALPGSPVFCAWSSEKYNALEIVSGGFKIAYRSISTSYNVQTNLEHITYNYIAIG